MHPRHPLRSLLLACCAAAIFAAPAGAEESARPDAAAETAAREPVMLREVTVTATRTEREVFDVPSSVSVVDEAQIIHEPQRTIADQLRDIPGVQVSDGGMGGGAKRVSIRGESPSRVLVLIDGMKISEQKSMDGSMIMIDPLNVERIDVIKGPASVLYGSEAIGGVINIITKKGGDKPIQGALALTFDGSNESLTPYGSLYGSYKGFGYRVSGDYIDADDKRGGSGVIPNSSYQQSNSSAYLDYAWDGGTVGGGYDHFWSHINIPGSEVDGADVNMQLPRWQRDRWYAFGELNQISGVLRKARLTAFMQETKKDFWNDINVYVANPMGPNTYVRTWQHPVTYNDQKSYGGNLQTDWTFGDDHYVIAGVDYLYDDLNAQDHRQGVTTIKTPAPFPVTTVTDEYLRYKAHQQTIALFAQDEWTFHPDWTATIGLRQTWVESALDSTNDNTLDTADNRDAHLVGSLGLVYSGFDDWRLRAQYAQGYRYPLLHQLYIGTTHGQANSILLPNPDLKPETSQNFELGARYEAFGFSGDLAVYYSLADNYIAERRVSATTRVYENVANAETYGVELTLGYTCEPWGLTPYVSGGYMRRHFDWGTRQTSQTGDPMWTGRAGLRYERELSPALSLYADAYGRFAASAKETFSDGTFEDYAGWGTANLALGARLGEDRRLFVDLNLNNLLNKRYTLASSQLESAGFHAVLRVGLEF